MYSSDLRSRAGLVQALVFALIISLVSAAPIPISAPLSLNLSSASNNNRQDLIQPRIPQVPLSRPISTIQFTTTGTLGGYNTFPDEDNQLVRRESLGARIRDGFRRLGRGIKHIAQKIGSGIKRVAQKIGSGIKRVAQKIGSGIKRVAQKIGTGIKKVAQKIGTGIKKAAVAVGRFVKTNFKKIIKFGAEVVSVAAKGIGKVLSFIPEIGKPISEAFDGISKGASEVSEHIHANLGKKLDKGMKGMEIASDVMDVIPRRRDLPEGEGFQQRDISDAYYFNFPGARIYPLGTSRRILFRC